MSKATMTVEGFVARDLEVRDAGGKPVVNVVVPHTPQKRDQAGQWVDAGETLWVEVAFWERDAHAIAAMVRKGTLVTITGTPELRPYTKTDGTPATKLTLKFATLGVIPRDTRSQQPWGRPAQVAADPVEAWAAEQAGLSDTPF